MCDLSFVSLTWNSQRYVRRCVESIAHRCEADRLTFEVLVVDNGSADDTIEELSAIKAEGRIPLTVLTLGTNRGTTYSRNLALRQCQGATVCVIDSDTEFRSGSLRPLIRLLESQQPSLGLVAPRLLLPDGSVQHSVKQFPTLLNKLRKIPAIVLRRPVPRADFYPSFPFTACTFVDTAISACWFFPRGILDRVGDLDEGIFYAPEDVEYCARLREAGFRIVYYPHLTLLHHTQQISHRQPLSKTSLSHLKGLLRYHRVHGGWFAAQGPGPEPAPALEAAVRTWLKSSGPDGGSTQVGPEDR